MSNQRDLFLLKISSENSLNQLEIGFILKQIAEEFIDEHKNHSDLGIDALGQNNSVTNDTGEPGPAQLSSGKRDGVVEGQDGDLPTQTD